VPLGSLLGSLVALNKKLIAIDTAIFLGLRLSHVGASERRLPCSSVS